MSKEKQIEEMAISMVDSDNKEAADALSLFFVKVAEHLYNAGYRKQREVINEFAEKLKEAPIKCGLPLLGLTTKEEIEEYFDSIMLQFRDTIDRIVKETILG